MQVILCGMVAAMASVAVGNPRGVSTSGPMYLPTNRGTPAPRSFYEIPSYGVPDEFDDDNDSEPANYEFEYNVNDIESGNDFGHRESRQGHVTQGTYRVALPDGRTQIVDYVADQSGYRPKVRYEGQAKAADGYDYNESSEFYK